MTLLRELREQAELSQVQVAADLGIGVSTLNRHERGKLTPSLLQLRGYASYYGVDPDSIEQPQRKPVQKVSAKKTVARRKKAA